MAISCCGNGDVWSLFKAKLSLFMTKVEPSGNNALIMRKKIDNTQNCPVCGHKIGNVAGSKDAICTNCGFKDPCCE